MDNILQFATDLINKTGLANLPEDLKQEKINEMALILQKEMGEAILANLSETARLEYLDLLKDSLEPSPKDLEKFLKANLPNYLEIVQGAIGVYGEQYLNAMK